MATPLAPGWTEHKAPTGHSYFYNNETKKSTYTRPIAQAQAQAPPPAQFIPSYGSGQLAGGFQANQFQQNQYSGPQYQGNQFPAQFPGQPPGPQAYNNGGRGGRGGFRGGRGDSRGGHANHDRRRQEPEDKPKHRYKLPGCDPWVLVKTKLGRRFVHNTDTKESFWKFPEDVMVAVIEYDRREREKKERRERGEPSDVEDEVAVMAEEPTAVAEVEPGRAAIVPVQNNEAAEDSSEYEEIEVTDDEEEAENGEGPSKRQRTDEPDDQPVDFDEDDIAYQLQAMGEDYGLDPGEYGIDEDGTWEEGAEGLPLTEEDSKALFYDLLNDFMINPYTPWEKVVEDGYIIDDDRYLALPNMKARKDCYDEWSREKIQELRERREKEAKKDPKIPYFKLLEEYASVKLYWPEFKRKYRKEGAMRDTKVPDKEKEKLYREHVKRLQLPQNTLKSDLSTMLKAQPLSQLNRSTPIEAIPSAILTDLRYISLPPKIRDPLLEAFISTLPPPPTDGVSAEDQEAEAAKRRERRRREDALAEREARVQNDKRKQQKDLAYGRGKLREEEMELQRAMNVGKDGLRGQLMEQLGEKDERSLVID
ncbi:hypothetical protein EJ08DRAFT_582601 [Tothia fuscella]|uniref:WW domain-containing protein n=1 Tax=Tothia fuscella TaxID=1048955 RepID=A0A9P4U2M5_9PEZI|nr:hypothetical protein EJ08DRAFT_582601 [Tothia fuscella]